MDLKFVVTAVYSVLSLCGGFNELPDSKLTSFDINIAGPVFQSAEPGVYTTESFPSAIKSNDTKQIDMISGMYIPGFDINRDGQFDDKDVEEINSLRKQKKTETDRIRAEEEAAEKKAEEERKAAETEPAVTELPEVTEQSEITSYTEVSEEENSEPVQDEFPAPKEMRGIDVSKWQGKIDWNRVRDAGKEFVIIKAGEGTEVAKNFYTNIEGAKEAGLACGIYWFSNARSYDQAVAEAEACLEVASQYKLEFPVVCDFEYRSIEKCGNPLENDKTAATDAILGFLDTVEQGGYYAMLYTNKNFSGKYFEFSRITEKYDIWCAGYSLHEPNIPCGIWQYSQTGYVDGIDIESRVKNSVDLDISYRDYPEIMKYLHINGY